MTPIFALLIPVTVSAFLVGIVSFDLNRMTHSARQQASLIAKRSLVVIHDYETCAASWRGPLHLCNRVELDAVTARQATIVAKNYTCLSKAPLSFSWNVVPTEWPTISGSNPDHVDVRVDLQCEGVLGFPVSKSETVSVKVK